MKGKYSHLIARVQSDPALWERAHGDGDLFLFLALARSTS